MHEKVQRVFGQLGTELKKRSKTVDNVFQLQIHELYNQHHNRDRQINLPGGFILQLWIMLDSLSRVDCQKQQSSHKKELQKTQGTIDEYTAQMQKLQAEIQGLKDKGRKVDDTSVQTVNMLGLKISQMQKVMAGNVFKYKKEFDDQKITDLMIDMFCKLVKQPTTFMFSDTFFPKIERLQHKMETSLPVFMVKKDKMIGEMSSVESLGEMFSSRSLLHLEINSPVSELDP